MSFLPERLVHHLALRAELTLGLIRLGRYDDAVLGALPLIGTGRQAWFLHARAWQEWYRGEVARARTLLKEALDLLGRAGGVEFLVVDCKPVILAEFSASWAPVSQGRTRRRSGDLRFLARTVDSVSKAEQMFAFLFPLLPVCVAGVWVEHGFSGERSTDPWNELLLTSLVDERLRLDMAAQFWKLWGLYPFSVAVAASAGFYLILTEQYHKALKVCRTFLLQRPYISIIRALEIVCLYRLGRRHDATSEGEYLMAHPRRDGEGVGLLLLGMLALEEGAYGVASRFFQESAARGNLDAASFDSTIACF